MNYHFGGLMFSLIIHAVMFAFLIALSVSIGPINKPIVIDFNMENSRQSAVNSRKSEIREQKQIIEKSTSVADAHPVPITKSQVQIPSVQPHIEQVAAKSEGHIVASSRTGTSSDDKKGNDAVSVNSEEKARIRYLREHFAYIRDTIMKNLSYPHMARKMGWEGKVTVSFIVYENGQVENIKILESSGFGILDKNAVETIKRVSSFPKPPVRAELIMPILYRLN